MNYRAAATTLIATATVLGCATASSASAATMRSAQPCFTTTTPTTSQALKVNVTGGQAGSAFQLSTSGAFETTAIGTFDTEGVGQAEVPNFSLGQMTGPRKGVTVNLTATDVASGAQIAATRAKVTNFAFALAQFPEAPQAARVWKVSGLTPLTGRRNLYATWRSGGKTLKRAFLGRANACGYLRVKRSALPAGISSADLYVQAQKKFSTKKPYLVTKNVHAG